ncbi:DUF3817 domain-containing protein [Streptomyces argenteolus]|uniref:DUF3817 domain-containing protein n=1 Tax=Streptomyces argenteolus TaxID=67274 RepID=A0ABW6X5V4_9ACTN
MRLLRISARAELVSLLVLLVNLATAHLPAVSSLMGPTHGCAYLFVVIATARTAGASRRMKLYSLVPGVGGLLALRWHAGPGTSVPDPPAAGTVSG